MKAIFNKIKRLVILVTLTLVAFSGVKTAANELPAQANTAGKMAKELSMFEKYIGTWESSFNVGEGKGAVNDVSKWERALNGNALRTLHSINNGEYGGESLIFFDHAKGTLVFYYFTTAKFYTHGEIEVIDDTTFVAYEAVSGNENGITKVKSTSQLLVNKMVVSTSYFQNGKWTEPEQRTYVPSNKTVTFK